MGNASSWLSGALCPEEQRVWMAAKSGDIHALRAALNHLDARTRRYLEWRDPVLGHTPLAVAAAGGYAQCVNELLQAGADAEVRDPNGMTPLHLAAKKGRPDALRALLDCPRVHPFATTQMNQLTALDLARKEFRLSESGQGLLGCVQVIEERLCVYSGWLYQQTDNILSSASMLSGLRSWKQRYCLVLRTADPSIVEIDLFPMAPGERRPPCPTMELMYRASDGMGGGGRNTWFDRRDFRFSLRAHTKSGFRHTSTPQTFEFAAANEGALTSWTTFFSQLSSGASRPAPSAQPASTRSNNTNQSCMSEQEERDMERAIQLSMQEAERGSQQWSQEPLPTAQVEASAPPAPADIQADTLFPTSEQTSGAAMSQSMPPPPSEESSGDGDGAGECIICFDNPQSGVCVPCGHNAICMDCAGEIMSSSRLCPVCRESVREVVKIYHV